MAALFLKSLIFPKDPTTNTKKYTPLRSQSPIQSDSDMLERGTTTRPSLDSTTSTSSTTFNTLSEKAKSTAYSVTSTLLPTRINPRIISDATIGLSDGLTVPFALTAGLSALGQTNVVVLGGLAELIAGGISMGLGGYLGARSEAEAYQAALAETKKVVASDAPRAAGMVREAFGEYDFSDAVLEEMVSSLFAREELVVGFLMKFHHQLAEADFAPSKAYISGLTIASGYVCGGLVALLPYLFLGSIRDAFYASILVMALALFVFGWVKTSLVGESDRFICFKNGVQMMVLGGLAAGAAMACVKAISD